MHDHVLVSPDPLYRLDGSGELFGFEQTCSLLDESAALFAMRTIVDRATKEPDTVTPLVGLLARWLIEAGLETVEEATELGRGFSSSTGEPLLLSRGDYTYDYFLRRIDRAAPFANRWVWKLAGAINRFYHTGRALGTIVDGAVERRCAKLDNRLLGCERLLRQIATSERSSEAPTGEWEARRRLAALMKTLVVPLGFRANFQLDLAGGLLCWGIVTPNEEEIPPMRFSAEEQWVALTFEERAHCAQLLAERVGLALALGAKRSLPSLETITVAAFPHFDSDDELAQTRGAEFPKRACDPFYDVTLTGSGLDELCSLGEAIDGLDTHRYLADQSAAFGSEAGQLNPYRALRNRPIEDERANLPEAGLVVFTESEARLLGCSDSAGLRISADGIVRHAAVSLAQTLARAATHEEAIAAIRSVQDATADPLVFSGCNRLMTGLLQDDIDRHDQNLVVFTMMPDDPCEAANIRFEGAMRGHAGRDGHLDPSLLQALAAAVETTARDDTNEVAYRAFETYAQRVLYNLDRMDSDHPDHERSVALLSVSLIYSLLNIAHYYAATGASAEALNEAYRAIAYAPTDTHVLALAGQAAARAGEMEAAREMYECALSWSTSHHEAADVYLQLGTVLWQAGDNETGSACLMKAAMLSPLVAPKAQATQWSLAKATGRFPAPMVSVDGILDRAEIGGAPDATVADDLAKATEALVDANVFRAALDIMAGAVRSHPDPLLWGMYSSLYRAPSIDADALLE